MLYAAICPQCGGPGGHLGHWGRADWFRCQHCGLVFHEDDE